MNINRLLRTVGHLKPIQVAYQLKKRIFTPPYVQKQAPEHVAPVLTTEPIPRNSSLKGDEFTFLNLSHCFTDWNYAGNGALFTYNQNYFDFINASDFDAVGACDWIDKFIADCPSIVCGIDPYPLALRSINWMKFFAKHPECITKEREDSLWSQLCLLEKKLEYHLMGNHLLEDSYALYIGGCYFNNENMRRNGYRILGEQLKEQTLEDGAHYEQSPMYHCILLDRLLDCINFCTTGELESFAQKQLEWLSVICYNDGSWPIFNDAAIGIAPTPVQIFDYAKRLGLVWSRGELGESGYRKLTNGKIEAFVDCGQIAASYQPGHSHADALNYEIRIDGQPVVVDTGISTYDKTSRRLYERSTIAHNCVSVEGRNSDEVWSGFRVGRQCKVSLLKDEKNVIVACHDGFGKKCYRKFELLDDKFCIEDHFDGEAISYVHLADGVNPGRVMIEGASKIDVLDTRYSIEYNRFIENKTLAIHFNGKLRYEIH